MRRLMLTFVLLSAVVRAQALDLNQQVNLDIPAQALPDALAQFSTQTGLEFSASTDVVEGKQSTSVKGRYTAHDALTALLKGTGLRFATTDGGVVAIKAVSPVKTSSLTRAASDTTESSEQNQPQTNLDSATVEGIEEIVVSAQKREERIMDVPVPVTALDASDLVNSNQLRLQDYYTKVPGLSVQSDGTTGVPSVSIRGLSTGGQANPTVGITVDDVPYGSSTFIGGGFVSPDIDPSELARIEVLRGPQGTLYGVSSIGGLLKYVTVDPSTQEFSGFLQGGLGGVRHGDGSGYNLRAAVNVPLGDAFAVRASGFTRHDAGYIDNIQTGKKGVNDSDADGGRISALWRPSESFSLKLSALLQNNHVHGSSLVDVSLGSGAWQQSFLRDTGGYEQRFEAYSANIAARLGSFEVTSVSGYGVNSSSLSYDLTPVYGALTLDVFGVEGTPYFNDLKTTKFSQEVRLETSFGEKADWLFGAFYTDEKSTYVSDVFAIDPVEGPILGAMLNYNNPTTFEEYAAFTDLTYRFTDRLDVQLGGRQSQIRHTNSATGSGPLNGGDTFTPQTKAKENSFTYLVTPRFKLSKQLMAYARLASGYRSGGPNANALALGVPPTYNPDETQNYDVGIKGEFFDRALSVDASVYYIDWKDVQVTLLTPDGAAVYIANGGGARSQGVELAVELQPRKGLTISSWVAWSDAELTKAFPADSSALGGPGDRLPHGSRFSGNFSVQQEFPLTGTMIAFVGGSVSYVGNRRGNFASVFASSPDRQIYSPYARTDLRAGMEYGDWTLNIYLNNATDRRGVLTGGVDGPSPTSFIYVQPRTFGASVTRTF